LNDHFELKCEIWTTDICNWTLETCKESLN